MSASLFAKSAGSAAEEREQAGIARVDRGVALEAEVQRRALDLPGPDVEAVPRPVAQQQLRGGLVQAVAREVGGIRVDGDLALQRAEGPGEPGEVPAVHRFRVRGPGIHHGQAGAPELDVGPGEVLGLRDLEPELPRQHDPGLHDVARVEGSPGALPQVLQDVVEVGAVMLPDREHPRVALRHQVVGIGRRGHVAEVQLAELTAGERHAHRDGGLRQGRTARGLSGAPRSRARTRGWSRCTAGRSGGPASARGGRA